MSNGRETATASSIRRSAGAATPSGGSPTASSPSSPTCSTPPSPTSKRSRASGAEPRSFVYASAARSTRRPTASSPQPRAASSNGQNGSDPDGAAASLGAQRLPGIALDRGQGRHQVGCQRQAGHQRGGGE